MSGQDDHAERIAQAFHEAYERLALDFGYETRKESAVPWADVPEQNKRLMVAVAGEVFAAVEARLADAQEAQREMLARWDKWADELLPDLIKRWPLTVGIERLRASTAALSGWSSDGNTDTL